MVRNKKKMTPSDFEEYVVSWWVEQVEHNREIVEELETDRSLCEQERTFIFSGIAEDIVSLLELINPCIHDELQLLDWCKDFVTQWQEEDFSEKN